MLVNTIFLCLYLHKEIIFSHNIAKLFLLQEVERQKKKGRLLYFKNTMNNLK